MDGSKNMSVYLIYAIAREEGYYIEGSRARRNNNPGNIEMGKFAKAHGAVASDGRFAIFDTPSDGFRALSGLLNSAYKNLTVAQIINKWAPPRENDTEQYIKNICEWTGLTPDTVLTKFDEPDTKITSAAEQKA